MSDLKVALLQTRVHWHDAAANRDLFEDKIRALDRGLDVIVLTETFTSGFTQQPEQCAEDMAGPSVAWMRAMAQATDAAIVGSLVIEEGGQYFNRLVFMPPDGTPSHYDKRHLFRVAGEHERYAPGNRRLVVEFRGWRLCPMVCYDLRFPVWIRNRGGEEYDALIFVANWPRPRALAWSTLLRARAIENLAYVLGVNRVGRDGKDIDYGGGSAAIDYLGQPLAEANGGEAVLRATLERAPLEKFRSRFPFHVDADEFRLGGMGERRV